MSVWIIVLIANREELANQNSQLRQILALGQTNDNLCVAFDTSIWVPRCASVFVACASSLTLTNAIVQHLNYFWVRQVQQTKRCCSMRNNLSLASLVRVIGWVKGRVIQSFAISDLAQSFCLTWSSHGDRSNRSFIISFVHDIWCKKGHPSFPLSTLPQSHGA